LIKLLINIRSRFSRFFRQRKATSVIGQLGLVFKVSLTRSSWCGIHLRVTKRSSWTEISLKRSTSRHYRPAVNWLDSMDRTRLTKAHPLVVE